MEGVLNFVDEDFSKKFLFFRKLQQ
jgi:hypothetical protein